MFDSIRHQRTTLGMSKDFSFADMLTIVGMVAGMVWVGAFIKADVDTNSREVASAKAWIQAHSNEDRAGAIALDERLRHIEEKLDTLIGEEKGRKGAQWKYSNNLRGTKAFVSNPMSIPLGRLQLE